MKKLNEKVSLFMSMYMYYVRWHFFQASNMEAVQKNLQQIWLRLSVPPDQQIDMAIKYSGDITETQLNKVNKVAK